MHQFCERVNQARYTAARKSQLRSLLNSGRSSSSSHVSGSGYLPSHELPAPVHAVAVTATVYPIPETNIDSGISEGTVSEGRSSTTQQPNTSIEDRDQGLGDSLTRNVPNPILVSNFVSTLPSRKKKGHYSLPDSDKGEFSPLTLDIASSSVMSEHYLPKQSAESSFLTLHQREKLRSQKLRLYNSDFGNDCEVLTLGGSMMRDENGLTNSSSDCVL